MACNRTSGILITGMLVIAVSACSRDQTPAAKAVEAPAASPVATSVPQEQTPTACALVTAAEMSAILGSVVTAQPHEGSVGKTECIYQPATAPSPYADVTVDWEDGKEAMAVMGGMNKAEPGIADPYAGIGDKAVATGPVLMVLNGEDMVTITFSGVDDMPGKARQVFDTAKPRMHPGH